MSEWKNFPENPAVASTACPHCKAAPGSVCVRLDVVTKEPGANRSESIHTRRKLAASNEWKPGTLSPLTRCVEHVSGAVNRSVVIDFRRVSMLMPLSEGPEGSGPITWLRLVDGGAVAILGDIETWTARWASALGVGIPSTEAADE